MRQRDAVKRLCCVNGVETKIVAQMDLRLGRKAVELVRCGPGLTAVAVQLPLAEHVHGFEAVDVFCTLCKSRFLPLPLRQNAGEGLPSNSLS